MNARKAAALIVLALVLASSLSAADVSAEASQEQTAATPRAERKIRQEERVKARLEKKVVTYDGFVTDVVRAEKKSRLFSLRQPRDPKTDTTNLALDDRSGRPRGFVLFRIGF